MPIAVNAKERPYEVLIEMLRQRVTARVWTTGEMIPGRRRLATEFGVSLSTVERAVAALIAEGLLRADDRRGTFVAALPTTAQDPAATTPLPIGAGRTTPLVGTVGLVAGIIPYGSAETTAQQWPARVLAACEGQLSAAPGLSQRFVNLIPAAGDNIPLADAVEELLIEGVDAIVVLGSADGEALVPIVRTADRPVVCATFEPLDVPLTSITIDDPMGGVLAARHLHDRGYQDLLFPRPCPADWIEARLRGAQAELGVDGLEVLPLSPMLEGPGDAATMRDAGRELYRTDLQNRLTPETGIIAANDALAEGIIEEAAAAGVTPGSDYGIIGFDDTGRELQLTSLRPPLEELGTEAARVTLASLRGEPIPSRTALPPRLIARASTTKPKRRAPARREE